jgi:hypothetical protein
MANEISAVLEFGAPEPGETATMMEDKLRFPVRKSPTFCEMFCALTDVCPVFMAGVF